MLYPPVPHLSQTQQHPRVGTPSCCFVKWQMNKPENIDFIHQSVSLYSSIILQYTLCANASEIIKTFYLIKMHAFPSLLVNNHNKTVMEDPHPHTSVTINWTSLRQLHLIWRSCLCKACVQGGELSGFCSCATKSRKKSGSNNILTTSTRLLY